MTPLFLSISQYFLGKKEDEGNLLYVNLTGTFLLALAFSGMFIGVPLSSSWKVSFISVDSLQLHWGGAFTKISSVFLLVCLWLNVFSKGLIKRLLFVEDASQARLFLYLDLFLLAAFISISADYFLPLFVGWELLGIVAYLLLGFCYESSASNQAAFTAFLYDKIGSIFLLLGGSLLLFSYGDISFSDPQWGSIRQSFIGLCFFISIYCKMFQFGVNTWVSRSTEIPALSLSVVANFLFGIPAFVLLWKLHFLEVDFFKTLSLYLGIATFVFAIGMALMDSLFKRVTTYITIAYWGLILSFSTFGFYEIAFACLLGLSLMQFILFGIEKVLSSENKEPFHLGTASLNRSPRGLFVGLIVLLTVCHTGLLGVMGVIAFGSAEGASWVIGGGIFLLSLSVWRVAFLLCQSSLVRREALESIETDQLWTIFFFVLSAVTLVGGAVCFWLSVRAPFLKNDFSHGITASLFIGSGIILSGVTVFLFKNMRRTIEKNVGWGYQLFLKQAYLETLYTFGVVKTFKWISTVLSEKVDEFLIEQQAFVGSISGLNGLHRLIFWVQTQTFSFYLFFLVLSCSSLLLFLMLK